MCFQLKPDGVGTRLGSECAGGAGEVLGVGAAAPALAAEREHRVPRELGPHRRRIWEVFTEFPVDSAEVLIASL